MSQAFSLTGLVLWRDHPDEAPSFKYGTLRVHEGICSSFEQSPKEGPAEAYIVPGFVDMHAHMGIGNGPSSSEQITQHAWEQIRAGVLAVREPGSPVKISKSELPYERPIIVSSGRHIGVEKRYIRGLSVELPSPVSADAARVRALGQEVVRQAKIGDGWVKLVGDWIDRSGADKSDLRPLWSGYELKEAVKAAHGTGAKVAVHIFGASGIDDLLDAGVDSIEHGTGMTLEQIKRAADQGIVVVPTLIQVMKFPQFASAATRYPKYAQTMTGLYQRRHQWFADLLQSGVQIMVGSDAGGFQSQGALIKEMQTMVQWGMAPADVLDLATWKARDYLGLPSLSVGAPADAVIFSSDPRTSAKPWAEPKAIVANGNLL